MLDSELSKLVKLAAKKENTPELVSFWEKQYVDLLEKKMLVLDDKTLSLVANGDFKVDFLPVGYINILDFLKKDKIDESALQVVFDVSVRLLDNLVELFQVGEIDNLPSQRNVEIIIFNKNEFFTKLNLNVKAILDYENLFAKMIFRSSEFLAEEKGPFGNIVNTSQEIKPVEYQDWINSKGKIIGNGLQISKEFNAKTIAKSDYSIVPRRNWKLFKNENITKNIPTLENQKNKKIKTLSSNTVIADKDFDTGLVKNKIVLMLMVTNSGANTIAKNVGGKYILPFIEFDYSRQPTECLSIFALQKFKIDLDRLEIIGGYLNKENQELILGFSTKVNSQIILENLKDWEIIDYNNVKIFNEVSAFMINKFSSRNKLLTEFKDLLTNNPEVLTKIKKGSNSFDFKNNLKEKEILNESQLIIKEYEISTESFGKILIKISLLDTKMKRIEFMLNEDFKYRFATFYSSFVFITSFLNYMLSMDEDIQKLTSFLKNNMDTPTSLGLVSKVVYYSLQSIKELV
jgi:hypothetical protein